MIRWQLESLRFTIFFENPEEFIPASQFWNQILDDNYLALADFNPDDDQVQVAEQRFKNGIMQLQSQRSEGRLDFLIGAGPVASPELKLSGPLVGEIDDYEPKFLEVLNNAFAIEQSLARVAVAGIFLFPVKSEFDGNMILNTMLLGEPVPDGAREFAMQFNLPHKIRQDLTVNCLTDWSVQQIMFVDSQSKPGRDEITDTHYVRLAVDVNSVPGERSIREGTGRVNLPADFNALLRHFRENGGRFRDVAKPSF